MKKRPLTLMALGCALCCAFGMVACDQNTETGKNDDPADQTIIVKDSYKYDAETEETTVAFDKRYYSSFTLSITYTEDCAINRNLNMVGEDFGTRTNLKEGQKLIIRYGGNRMQISDQDGVVLYKERVLTDRGFDYYRYEKDGEEWTSVKSETYAALAEEWFAPQNCVKNLMHLLKDATEISKSVTKAAYSEDTHSYVWNNGSTYKTVSVESNGYTHEQSWMPYLTSDKEMAAAEMYNMKCCRADFSFYNSVPTSAKLIAQIERRYSGYLVSDVVGEIEITDIGTTQVTLPDTGHGSEVVSGNNENSQVNKAWFEAAKNATAPENLTLMKTGTDSDATVETLIKTTETAVYSKSEAISGMALDTESYTWKEDGNNETAYYAGSQNGFVKQELQSDQPTANKAVAEARDAVVFSAVDWTDNWKSIFRAYEWYYFDEYNGVYISCSDTLGDMVVKINETLAMISVSKAGYNVTVKDFGKTEVSLPQSLQNA